MRQQIISLMPPHQVYVEPFFGSGQIFYAKKPADVSIVADRDEGLMRRHAANPRPGTFYLVADAAQLLPSLKLTRQDLVYLDPPYHPDTRSPKIYRYELDARAHSALLTMLQGLDCNVILSGYNCDLYERALSSWFRLDYGVMTRKGPRVESAWCNFEPYVALHDGRFVGRNFRERERIKRKKARWLSRFLAMPPAERNVIGEALRDAQAFIDSRGAARASPCTTNYSEGAVSVLKAAGDELDRSPRATEETGADRPAAPIYSGGEGSADLAAFSDEDLIVAAGGKRSPSVAGAHRHS